MHASPPSTADLAAAHDQAVLAAQPDATRYGSGGLPIPLASVSRTVVLSDPKKIKTREGYERLQAEKNGYDPGLNQRFETKAQATEYRKISGIETMSKADFNAEVGNPSGALGEEMQKRAARRFPIPDNPPDIGGVRWSVGRGTG